MSYKHMKNMDMVKKSDDSTYDFDNSMSGKKKKSKRNYVENTIFSLQDDTNFEPKGKKHCVDFKQSEFQDSMKNVGCVEHNINEKYPSDSSIQKSIVYYENIFQLLKDELNKDSKDLFACNALQESEGKEVELSCHGTGSHCLELLLTECKDSSIMHRFMSAFAENKISVCTSSNASHITEKLIHYAAISLQDWSSVLNAEENSEEKSFVLFCLNWLTDFGEFVFENMNDCLYNSSSCHVACILIRALAGDLSGAAGFMSKNLKAHKQEFCSEYIGETSPKCLVQDCVVLDEIPKIFRKVLKKLYKSLLSSKIILDSLIDNSSAIVVEALLFALKKRLPKHCKRMIIKLAEVLFAERNQDNVPLYLLHKNCSFVFDEMFKVADDELQLVLWNNYIIDCLGKIVTHSVGNFVIQRTFEVIQNKSVFETVCEGIWPIFEDILKSQNFGVFVSLATTCNRLSAQQAAFMKNIMQCLHCGESEEQQRQVLPLILGFQKFENYISYRASGHADLKICLQGSLVAQAVMKFHKPLKIVHSMISMTPTDLEYLASHIQGCHVLNAFFGSVSVGEKNKEKLLHHLKPVMISIACDRQKSLTLSRIWVLLSLKLKEIIARELAKNKESLVSSSSGYAIWKKFGIHYFKRLQEWREIQANLTYNKKPVK